MTLPSLPISNFALIPVAGPVAGALGGVHTVVAGSTTDQRRARYATWAEAWEAAQYITPSTIFVNSRGGPVSVPAKDGGWDVSDISIVGGNGRTGVLLFDQGASFAGDALFLNNVVVNLLGSTPFLHLVDDQFTNLTLVNSAGIQCVSSVEAIVLDDAAELFMGMSYFSYIFTNDLPVVDVVSPDALMYIFADLACTIYANTIAGLGSVVVDDLIGLATPNPGINHTQPKNDIVWQYG